MLGVTPGGAAEKGAKYLGSKCIIGLGHRKNPGRVASDKVADGRDPSLPSEHSTWASAIIGDSIRIS